MPAGSTPTTRWRRGTSTSPDWPRVATTSPPATTRRYDGPGTDLRVDLPDGARWVGGATDQPGARTFVPNLPTEELFTVPHRLHAEGRVRATKPLSYFGTLTMLFDENDACHIALGRSYPVCVDGGTDMDDEERLAAGLNHSGLHVDVVVGSTELDVLGVLEDGTEEAIIRAGEWGFDVAAVQG